MRIIEEENKKATEILKKLYDKYHNIIPFNMIVRYNEIYSKVGTFKSTNTLGTCQRIKCNNSEAFKICVNQELLKHGTVREIETTLLHEMIHTCKDCYNHGKLWKLYAEKINTLGGYNISRLTKSNILKCKQSTYKYALYCPYCGQTYYFRRMSKAVRHPEWCKCHKCKHTLESKKLK